MNDTPQLAPYSDLKKKAVSAEMGRYFICEGRLLVEEALNAAKMGRLKLVSVLCDSRQSKEWESKISSDAELFSLSADEINDLAGFQFHRGILCCCEVPAPPSEAQIAQSPKLLVLPQIDNADNLGQLLRTAAGLGMDAALLGKGPDPFSRRCVRVSMGAVWKMPVLKCDGLDRVLDAWLQNGHNLKSEIVGTADDSSAESAWLWEPAERAALVLGSESDGLDAVWKSKCTKHVRIPMAAKADSLNVSAAGAILMAKMVGT
ncbi:MAG: RNA methyltransferase [Holophagales bacterium]|jgi:tRNA G18 (ribose-2'-O)-methylase SpoU|nr:RNA methyltransferase [Holophagales bacterium]